MLCVFHYVSSKFGGVSLLYAAETNALPCEDEKGRTFSNPHFLEACCTLRCIVRAIRLHHLSRCYIWHMSLTSIILFLRARFLPFAMWCLLIFDYMRKRQRVSCEWRTQRKTFTFIVNSIFADPHTKERAPAHAKTFPLNFQLFHRNDEECTVWVEEFGVL